MTVSMPDHAALTVYEQIAPLNVNVTANDGWTVHSVTHNDTDVKQQLDAEGNYTIDGADAITHNLNVVFERNVVTGIDGVAGDFDDVRVTVTDGTIHISGARCDALAELYDLDGIKIYVGKERDIRVNMGGTFILCIGHRTFKLHI